eukprot:INCI6216.2.p1 GENE.INCI6216.2~~INCI6216.2.p1  ORF type:complete len:368 (-),score=68.55 INCI6216.2:138-1241(-)
MSFADHDSNDTVGILGDVTEMLERSESSVAALRRKTVKRVMMSGCYDLLHSGHVAAFVDAAKYGDLYVCLGSDKNIAQLKHAPTIPEEERRFMVQSIRHVHEARISRGFGDLDWLTEVEDIKPDFFFVNEDGDRQPKRDACARLGIKYIVGKRVPAEGLDARSSTDLKLSIASDKASAAVVQPRQKPKLVYFDGRGRADPVRFVLEASGLEYDEVYLKSREQFLALQQAKGELDFGQVPVLELEEANLVQSAAIIHYIAHAYGLAGPKDATPLQKYTLEEVFQGATDLRALGLGTPFLITRDGKTLEEVVGMLKERLLKYGSQFEALLKRVGPSPFLAGTSLTSVKYRTLSLCVFDHCFTRCTQIET